MTDHLVAKHATDSEIIRAIQHEIQKALEHIQDFGAEVTADHDDAIHEIRKHLKCARALIRLLRDEIGVAAYRIENSCFRDTSRLFAASRDSRILIELFDRLVKKADLDPLNPELQCLREHLIIRKQEFTRALNDSDVALSARQRLLDALDRMEQWPQKDHSANLAILGLKRTYSAGRKAFNASEASRIDDLLHEWRKQAKYLRHQLEFYSSVWPVALDQMAESLHILTDHLGDDHDLTVLRTQIAEFVAPACRDVLERCISDRRADLQDKAFELGKRLYEDRPQLFAAQIRACQRQSKAKS